MQRNIEFKDFEPNESVKTVIGRLISKLQTRASRHSPELIHLRLMLDENATRKLYHVSLTLHLSGRTLAAKEEQHEMYSAIRAAFSEIERQLEKYKANLRREHWKRPERRAAVREMKAEAAASLSEESRREVFLTLVNPHLNRLYRFVGHLIRYAEEMGDLVEAELTPDDVVDGALIRAYRRFLKRPPISDAQKWLLRLALDQVDAEVLRMSVHT